MPKSSKKFVLSNSLLNAYGFRMLTAGVSLKEFKANPIMLWNHNRAFRGTKDEVLPLGYWEDIKIEGDDITAVPFFDDNDEFAMSIYHKVENGTIRMCSAGAVPIELSDDPKYLLPGQTRPTFLKWKMKEASITDIGANPGSVAVALYDESDNLVTLSDNSLNELIPLLLQQKEEMKITTLNAPAIIALLKLPAESDEAAVIEKINEMVTLHAKLDQDKKDLSDQLTAKETEVTNLKKEANSVKIEALVNKAISDRKIKEGEKQHYVALAETNFETVEKLLNGMAAASTVQSKLSSETSSTNEVEELVKLSYDELFKTGRLARLKSLDTEAYKAKHKEKYGSEPKSL